VFKQVRESAASKRLQPKPDLVVHAHRNERRRPVRRRDHAQTIRQRDVFDRYVQFLQFIPPARAAAFYF